ncbi:hypothetical protein B0H10DRAFT_2440809 [Mycena sp. CBHHK59/15]|nr:hypothetical protein B0H10DRAFT_2440809 [Mycena sp. CBHHK59/15]
MSSPNPNRRPLQIVRAPHSELDKLASSHSAFAIPQSSTPTSHEDIQPSDGAVIPLTSVLYVGNALAHRTRTRKYSLRVEFFSDSTHHHLAAARLSHFMNTGSTPHSY